MIDIVNFDPYYSNKTFLEEIHIADIHFGAPNVNPKDEYEILMKQFIAPITNLPFDILSIDGDLFHRKFATNSDVIMYALMFVNECVNLCRVKGATLVIINGTNSHDAGQLKLCYQFTCDSSVDVRIVETTQFLFIKGAKILCITEEYGKGAEYYNYFLHESGPYDEVFMHGTIKNSMYGALQEDLSSNRYPVFSIESFSNCRGPIIAGHVHIAGCYENYMYYCSSPIRFKHGEEEDKGFIVLLHDLTNGMHYMHFQVIESYKYITVTVDGLSQAYLTDPDKLIKYLTDLKEVNQIDYLRIAMNNMPTTTVNVVKEYYKQHSAKEVSFKDQPINKGDLLETTTEAIIEKYSGMEFLMDPKLNEYEKFVRFINYNKGSEYITVEKLKEIILGNA